MVLVSLLAVLGVAAALGAARPATASSRRRTSARRARYVAAHPAQASPTDLVLALERAGITPAQAGFVVRHGLDHGIRPFTLWLWLEQHGPASLAIVVAADLTQGELLTHLGAATSPDLSELRVFASANGLDADVPATVRRARRAPLRRGLAA